MKYEDVKLQPLKSNRFILLEELHYKDVTVPKGYVTNGANVPRMFWSIYPPNKSDFLPAVIIHDYLCDLELYKKADRYFHQVLKLLGVNKRNRRTLVKSVKLYHKIKYKI